MDHKFLEKIEKKIKKKETMEKNEEKRNESKKNNESFYFLRLQFISLFSVYFFLFHRFVFEHINCLWSWIFNVELFFLAFLSFHVRKHSKYVLHFLFFFHTQLLMRFIYEYFIAITSIRPQNPLSCSQKHYGTIFAICIFRSSPKI